MPETKSRAVIYARYSSNRQQETSIEGQMSVCHAYARAEKLTIIDEYIDRKISGKTDNRKAFQKMLSDSDKKLFDVVLVYSSDRMARNRFDSAVNKKRLKDNNVKLICIEDNIPTGPTGILVESLMEGLAEYYSAELSQKVKRGMHETAKHGRTLGGHRPLGYRRGADGKYEIVESEAIIIRKIFDMYASGETCIQICRQLNALGYNIANNSKFGKTSMARILQNKQYIGQYKGGEVIIENGNPAIVDTQTFKEVQKKLEENKTHPQKHIPERANYMLSGKLYCGLCGEKMSGYSGTGKSGTKYYYYVCGKQKKGNCEKSQVRKDWLEELIIDETIKKVLNKTTIEKLAVEVSDILIKDRGEDEDLKILENKLKEVTTSINNIISLIEQGKAPKSILTRLEELETQQIKLEHEIQLEEIKTPVLDANGVEYVLNQYLIHKKESEEQYRERIIESFIHKVFLHEEKAIVVYNITNSETELLKHQIDFLFDPDPERYKDEKGFDLCSALTTKRKPRKH